MSAAGALAVGVDHGGTNLRAALVDTSVGTVLAEDKRAHLDRSPEAIASSLIDAVRTVDPDRRRGGVGIGIAAMLRGWTGVVIKAPNLGWTEVAFRALLEERLSAPEPVELYNDLNAIALGEARYGGARGTRDVLCVYLGTGIGAGLVVEGKLYAGATHLAGEIGHAKVVLEGGRLCGCGERGCLEAYASGNNIATRAREELAGGQKSRAVELAGAVDRVHAGHLDEAARGGDAYALALWDEVSRHAGLALGAAVTLLNPSRLVLGGGVLAGAPFLGDRVRERLRRAANPPSLVGFEVVETTLGDHAGVLGAAAAVLDRSGART
jgi:glucokinase